MISRKRNLKTQLQNATLNAIHEMQLENATFNTKFQTMSCWKQKYCSIHQQVRLLNTLFEKAVRQGRDSNPQDRGRSTVYKTDAFTNRRALPYLVFKKHGAGGIRTHEVRDPAVFKTAALSHSATAPRRSPHVRLTPDVRASFFSYILILYVTRPFSFFLSKILLSQPFFNTHRTEFTFSSLPPMVGPRSTILDVPRYCGCAASRMVPTASSLVGPWRPVLTPEKSVPVIGFWWWSWWRLRSNCSAAVRAVISSSSALIALA